MLFPNYLQANGMAIRLSKEQEERLIGSLQRFFKQEMDQELGNLQSQFLLDFCLREMGPSIYNQAIADAQTHLQERITEMDIDCHEQEFAYWKK